MTRSGGAVTSPRTIRRDLDALQQAGFALFDEKIDGKVYWEITGHPFRTLAETGLTLPELCAFYLSRKLLECLAGAPFSADLKTGFDKVAGVLTPRMRHFLDRLPSVLVVKEEPGKKREATTHTATVAEIEEAREQYAPRLSFEMPQPLYDGTAQRAFPFAHTPS